MAADMNGGNWTRIEGEEPAAEAGCDLCADECRGHPLGHSDKWKPERGSRAWLIERMATMQEALRIIEDGEGDADVIARQTLEELGIPTRAALEGVREV